MALQWNANSYGFKVWFGGGTGQRLVRVHRFGPSDLGVTQSGPPDALYQVCRLHGLSPETYDFAS